MKITVNEMRGILNGKCLPGDLRVNEEIPDYLVRKFADQAVRIAALTAKYEPISADYSKMKNRLAEQQAVIDQRNGERDRLIKELTALREQEPVAWLNDAYLARSVVDGEAGSEDAGPGYIPVYREPAPVAVPADLHPETTDLVKRFAVALAEKLYSAQQKYGYDADWKRDGWPSQCLAHFHQHIAKGDPRDVAAYCAFMWHHGWVTELPAAPVAVPDELLAAIEEVIRISDRDHEAWHRAKAAIKVLRLNSGSKPQRFVVRNWPTPQRYDYQSDAEFWGAKSMLAECKAVVESAGGEIAE